MYEAKTSYFKLENNSTRYPDKNTYLYILQESINYMNMGSYNCCSPSSKESKQLVSLTSVLKLVSEESRLKILCILRKGEHCVCEIMEHVDMSQSLISHHLSDLKEADVVSYDKRGLRVYYSLTEVGKHITDLLFQIPKKVSYAESFAEAKEVAEK